MRAPTPKGVRRLRPEEGGEAGDGDHQAAGLQEGGRFAVQVFPVRSTAS